MHRLFALRARLRRDSRHVCADNTGPGLQLQDRRQSKPDISGIGMRVLRPMRRSVPDWRPRGKISHCHGRCRPRGHDDVRLLRRRVFVQSRNARLTRREDGSQPRWACQPRACVCKRPVCLRLRHTSRSNRHSDDSEAHHRRMEQGLVGRGHSVRRLRVAANSVPVRQGRNRRNHVVALHERRNVPRAKDGAGRVRDQQCRHVRPCVSFPDGLWPQAYDRRIRRYAGI